MVLLLVVLLVGSSLDFITYTVHEPTLTLAIMIAVLSFILSYVYLITEKSKYKEDFYKSSLFLDFVFIVHYFSAFSEGFALFGITEITSASVLVRPFVFITAFIFAIFWADGNSYLRQIIELDTDAITYRIQKKDWLIASTCIWIIFFLYTIFLFHEALI